MPLLAWLVHWRRQERLFSSSGFQASDYNRATHLLVTEFSKLLDIVEGSILFKSFVVGRIIGQDGRERQVPEELETQTPEILTQARACAFHEWQLTIDGIAYGRGIKRLGKVSGAAFRKQVTWNSKKCN